MNNKGHTDMIYYWNFIMINEQHTNERVRYKIMHILSELGGLFSTLTFLIGTMFSLYNY